MKKISKLGLCVVVIFSVYSTPVKAWLFGDFDGATEWTQLLNNAELASQTLKISKELEMQIKQFQKWQREIESLKMLAQNIGKLPNDMQNKFLNMALHMKKEIEHGAVIAGKVSAVDKRFKQYFKGYDSYLKNLDSIDFESEYRNIYKTTRDTTLNTLKSISIQEEDLENDKTYMNKLKDAMSSSDGTEATLKVANDLAYHQTLEFQKLRQTVMTQAKMQTEWIAKQNEVRALKEAAREKFYPDIKDTSSDDKSPIRYMH